jgi:ribosomal protein L11 methyltransferase
MTRQKTAWDVLRFEIPGRVEEDLIGLLDGRFLGVRVHPAGSERSTLEICLDDESELPELQQAVLEGLNLLDAGAAVPEFQLLKIPNEDWVENYQAGLKPFLLGKRFLIVPGEELPGKGQEAGNRMVLRLVPGRAFGTGEHPTTALSVEVLEDQVKTGSSWLDVGTGSGILAAVASMLGAGKVAGLENDPDALSVCREVMGYNGLEGRVELLEGSLEKVEGQRYDGLVANINSSFFLANADKLPGLLNEGGILVCTGLLLSDLAEISECLAKAGFSIFETRKKPPWVLLMARL